MLKLGESLRADELAAIMAMPDVSFTGDSDTDRLVAMRWLASRATDMGWSVELAQQGGAYSR